MYGYLKRAMEDEARREKLFLGVVCLVALLLHLWLIPKLNIVEDESAYMQDAAQITPDFLPFREFGGTKGPLWLFLFKGWQLGAGQTIFASRLFSSLAHVGSIVLVWLLARSFPISRRAAGIATILWGLSAVVVSLSTNITHIPLELVCVLAGFYLLRRAGWKNVMLAALCLWAALLMRATAAAFAPAILALLLIRSDRSRAVSTFFISGVLLIALSLAIVYPLYGWPKTAFFFNLDATLIAGNQRSVYTPAKPISPFTSLRQAALPLELDGLSLVVPALVLPLLVVWRVYKKRPLPYGLVLLIAVWVGSFAGFYKAWGRTPTPFYPLESIPALALAAALVIEASLVWSQKKRLLTLMLGLFIMLFAADLLGSYRDIPIHQYRGTVEVKAAREVAAILRANVPPGTVIFTAQPVFPFLAGLPLYGGYTHAGWYLSERAGIIPPEIRRVFLPDFETLPDKVSADVTWIVVDWRTNDVYFNEKAPATLPMRELLARDFEVVATVANPASRDIIVYRRIAR
ncbi:MAG: glycosyltransferase family 39 protein [Candidatus Andersenbacteria bacterium]|nr:glycosyltransferase family 39 protein [Candidatus Andersenbacteria bacterium]